MNKKTVPCNYPVARLEDLFEATSGCDTFSVIDLKQAYYHIPIKAVDRPKTAFVVSDRKFEWLRMPFGLHGASFSLAAAMVEVLSDCRDFARAYYDDCIIFSKGKSAHLTHLKKLLEKFNLYGLHINLLKSQFMQSDVIFLGHILSGQGIFPEVGKVEEVVNFFTPTCAFWWPCLYQEITQFISDCQICLSVKRLCRNPGRMGMRSFPTSPMELVSIDYLVELSVTGRGNRHILSINDHFSKFSQIYAVPDRTAITAAKCVFDFFLRFGIPLKLYSDRDPAFEANLFQSLMKMFGVKKLRTTGYNPRANGLTEKANEFIKNYLASYVNYSDQEWDLWCREAAYAYNSSVHSSTGFTPAKLMFGRDYRVPLDVLYNVRNDSHAFTTVSQYERTLQNLYEIARRNMEARQVAAATYYDKKVLDDELKVGESVFVFAPRNKSKKLALKWFGPHRVITCKHPAYEIRTGSETKWVTRDKLKRVSSRVKPNIIKEPEIVTPQVVNELEDESSDSDSDEDVDIGHRGRGRYGLRPNPGLVQRLHPTFSHSLFF